MAVERDAACVCGHTAYWHSHGGAGDCEHDGDCTCQAFSAVSVYDFEKRAWVGQCPHGDVCSGCDALGYCTRAEGSAAKVHGFDPPWDDAKLGFFCGECGEPERVFIQHPNDERLLVCAVCGTHYETPEEGPWTFSETL